MGGVRWLVFALRWTGEVVTRYYIAASSHETDRAERVMQALDAAGFVCSHNWIPTVRAAFASGTSESSLDDAVAAEHARGDLLGVATCDVFVLLAPSTKTKGAWLEFGYALALGKRVVVAHDSPSTARQSIFTRLADAIVTDAEIVETVRELTRFRRWPVWLERVMSTRVACARIEEHARKFLAARDAYRIESLREQIHGDVVLVAHSGVGALDAFAGERRVA